MPPEERQVADDVAPDVADYGWDICSADTSEPGRIASLLALGWQPFAATAWNLGTNYHFRRAVPLESQGGSPCSCGHARSSHRCALCECEQFDGSECGPVGRQSPAGPHKTDST